MSTSLANLDTQFQRLEPYQGGVSNEAPRVTPLALISAGYRAEGRDGHAGLPKATRPGDAQQIHLHDPMNQAPGLRAALEANNWASLTIAFPLDDPRQFISQIFTRYSSTRLEAYGDANSVTYIDNRKATLEANHGEPLHRVFPAGSPEYERLVRSCKADTRIHFCLAEWTDDGSEVVFPDGLGVYAIRTTSRHSVRNLLGSIAYTAQFTHDRIPGLPFTLRIVHRSNVSGPDGTMRQIPVWAITTQPPEGVRLGSRSFRDIASRALREGAQLMLPSPATPTLEELDNDGPVESEFEVEEPTEEQMLELEAGGKADQAHWTRTWHAMSKGIIWQFDGRDYDLTTDGGRSQFIWQHTGGKTGSLSAFLQTATEEQAAELITSLATAKTQMQSRRYGEIFEANYDDAVADAPPAGKAPRKATGRAQPETPSDTPATDEASPEF